MLWLELHQLSVATLPACCPRASERMRRALTALMAAPAAGLLLQLLLQLLVLGPMPAAAAVTWWKPPRLNRDGSFLRWQYQLSADTAADIKYVPGVQVVRWLWGGCAHDSAAIAFCLLAGGPQVPCCCIYRRF